MATAEPLQNMVHHDANLHDLGMWAKRQVLQIESLSKQQVLLKLQNIMEGHSYSWHCINELLQARFEEGSLEFSLIDGVVLFEWNNLCDEKRVWKRKGRLSVNNAEFNMACLINLKILPFQAGLGIEAIRLVTSNMDNPNMSIVDLWAGPRDADRRCTASWFLTDDDTSSLESSDSDYVDEAEETDDEVVERKVAKVDLFDDGDIDQDKSDEGMGVEDDNLSEDGFDEESEDCGNSSVDSEVEIEDEDFEGLGVKIVDIDDDEISDLEL